MKTPSLLLRPSGLAVRYQTALCDRHGRVERILQRGTNMITDWGMNALGADKVHALITHLHLSSATETLKRLIGGGNSITVDHTDPAAVLVTAATNYFEAGDVGRVLKITGWPELEITGFTSATAITAKARNSAWLPGFTPPGTGPFTAVGIHYTNKATLGTQFTSFNTFDTAAANNNAELNDSPNSRWIHQRIFLSAVVSGSPWTVNQIGWGQGSTNVFGKANLLSADTVPVGKRYRVTLQVYSAYTPIDLTGVSLDWGASIGTHTCDLRMHRIGKDSGSAIPNLMASFVTVGNFRAAWWTNAQSVNAIQWEGDVGFTAKPSGDPGANVAASGVGVIAGAYTAGTHTVNRTFRWPEANSFTAATKLGIVDNTSFNEGFQIVPSTTITKPSGWRMDLIIPIHWTRGLIN